MKIFEHRAEYHYINSPTLQVMLNRLSEAGWELVTVVPDSQNSVGGCQLFFKREIQQLKN